MAVNLDVRCVLVSDPSTLGAGAKTRLHTPKAVTYHEQSQIIHHDRSQPWAYGIQNKEVYAPLYLQAHTRETKKKKDPAKGPTKKKKETAKGPTKKKKVAQKKKHQEL